MDISTAGIELKTKRRWLADSVELVSSMRFAISLLTLIAIASIIGTVLKQNEPMTNYVNQFGPFWFDIYDKLGLYSVYSTWWFLMIMGFLVLSTSLCIWRNAPKMFKDMRSWKENVREQSLRNFHHKAEWTVAVSPAVLAGQLVQRIRDTGYKAKVLQKEQAILITAKKGAANKWGYIFAHSAIVVICIGGLLDSELPIRMQQWFNGKTPFAGSGLISAIPPQHRLPVSNPTFRGNSLIPEGSVTNTAIIPQQAGVLIQDLPFTIELKRFVIDYYSTGMPKLFASDVVLTDSKTGRTLAGTIKVNQPLEFDGILLFQSSFEDGGSNLKLAVYPMRGPVDKPYPLEGKVNDTTPLAANSQYTVEWSGFRPFNIENVSKPGNAEGGSEGGQDVRAVNKSLNSKLADSLDKHLGSGAKNANSKDMKNVGPSVQYKLRDRTGQAREYLNYMAPIDMDGTSVFLAGMRDDPGVPFRYLRIPADDNASVDEWMRLRAALADPQLRIAASKRYAARAMQDNRSATDELRDQLRQSSQKGLDLFAGDGREAGYMAVSRFLQNVPQADQERAAEIFIKILNGSLWDLWQVSREHAGLKALEPSEPHARFVQAAGNALSDAGFYSAPVYLQLRSFEEIKASVLQLTRSPGKKVVYFGCFLLVLGVFSMLYIRERRVWVWIRPDGGSPDSGSATALMAMSSQRKTLDFEREFEQLKAKLAQSA